LEPTGRGYFHHITSSLARPPSCQGRHLSQLQIPPSVLLPVLTLPTAFSRLTCLQRGLCPVSLRGSQLESHSLYYEVYGSPATAAAIAPHAGDDEVKDHIKLKNKLVFIPGLNATYFCWDPQVRWFVPRVAGDDDSEEEEYTALVFDNRGVGNSGYPRGHYT
jgi:hypothetical protein